MSALITLFIKSNICLNKKEELKLNGDGNTTITALLSCLDIFKYSNYTVLQFHREFATNYVTS